MANTELSGAPVINQIEFISLLGVGGMSRVYKARQTLLDRFVAVKVLSKQALLTETAFKRFSVEAKLTSNLSHPNIVKVMNHGISIDGQAYLVMEFVEGCPLSEVISKDAPISYRRFQNIFISLLSALEHAHGKGIIHRDIKPSNIIISKDANGNELAKLVDFGIAKVLDESESIATTAALTKTGFAVGSPTYMSPEQCQGQQLDCRSDLYSLACVMYESLSGEPPYLADSSLDVMYKHMHEPRIRTRELSARMEIPEILVKAILWALNKELSKRPESASKLAARLSAALDEITLDRAPQRARKRITKGQSSLVKIACAFVATALVAFLCSYQLLKPKEQHLVTPRRVKVASGADLINKIDKTISSGKEKEGLEYCQSIIEAAKNGPKAELAEIYESAYEGLNAVNFMRSEKVCNQAITYAKQALAINAYFKNERGICENSKTIALISAKRKNGKEALKALDDAMALLPNSPGNQSWYVRTKLRCLLHLQRFPEAMKLGKSYVENPNTTVRNANYYYCWLDYTKAIESCAAPANAVNEQIKLAKALLKDQTPNIRERVSLFRALSLLNSARPSVAINILKEELRQNKEEYATDYSELECELRKLIGDAYIAEGSKDIAMAELLKVLHKVSNSGMESLSTIDLRRECLKSLIKISSDDPSAQAEYQSELNSLNPDKLN